jgi:class 3 adenylate cyclase
LDADPESGRQQRSQAREETRRILERHGGTVEGSMGDLVTAVFGVPAIHEDDALRATRAALELRAALSSMGGEGWRDPGARIAASVGVHTGEVVVETATASAGLSAGDVIAVAARLQQAAEPGEILLSEATHRQAYWALEVAPIDPIQVSARSKPIGAYRVGCLDPERPCDEIALKLSEAGAQIRLQVGAELPFHIDAKRFLPRLACLHLCSGGLGVGAEHGDRIAVLGIFRDQLNTLVA